MEPEARLIVAQDVANKAVVEFISSIHSQVCTLDGNANDFAFAIALSMDKIVISSLALLDELKSLQTNHVKAYKIMLEKLPMEMEIVLKKLTIREARE